MKNKTNYPCEVPTTLVLLLRPLLRATHCAHRCHCSNVARCISNELNEPTNCKCDLLGCLRKVSRPAPVPVILGLIPRLLPIAAILRVIPNLPISASLKPMSSVFLPHSEIMKAEGFWTFSECCDIMRFCLSSDCW